jgi:hypothetical protein
MLETILRDMLRSKKFLAAIAGVLVGLAGKIGLELEAESLIAVLSPIVAYILGQGFADVGKAAGSIDDGRPQ